MQSGPSFDTMQQPFSVADGPALYYNGSDSAYDAKILWAYHALVAARANQSRWAVLFRLTDPVRH